MLILAEDVLTIFARRRILLLGGAWGPWTIVNGNNVQVNSIISNVFLLHFITQ